MSMRLSLHDIRLLDNGRIGEDHQRPQLAIRLKLRTRTHLGERDDIAETPGRNEENQEAKIPIRTMTPYARRKEKEN